jgi:hypothetical protein
MIPFQNKLMNQTNQNDIYVRASLSYSNFN